MRYNEFLSPNAQMFMAAGKGDMTLLKKSIDQGADLNALDLHDTALIVACSRSNYSMAEFLLSKGADPNIIGYRGCTALMSACGYSDLRMVKLLLAHGAKADIKCSSGQTARDIAIQQRKNDIVEYLENFPK